ncbi:DUF6093 family protein [Streptomyces sp. NPDC056149]|uniref:DUF6093 family protein n=1 Tax=Streptomyces sp. NPDC056149 TaxID=3345728 RepID=UPI0035DE0E2F
MTSALDRLLAQGRTAAQQLMTDWCRIERSTGIDTTDDGRDVEQATTVYEGRCRVRPAAQAATTDKTGTVIVETWAYTVSVPLPVAGIRTGDAVQILASDDPGLVGRRLRVRSIDRGTQITARRLACEEVAR